MDGHPAQVDEAVLLSHKLQALYLVLDLYLALGGEAGHLSVASSPGDATLSRLCPPGRARSLRDQGRFL